MTIKESDTAQLIKKDLEEYHQEYFNNEFYEDCFIPHYWQNPFVNFLHSHFDMVKSWYLTDNTMFTRNEK